MNDKAAFEPDDDGVYQDGSGKGGATISDAAGLEINNVTGTDVDVLAGLVPMVIVPV